MKTTFCVPVWVLDAPHVGEYIGKFVADGTYVPYGTSPCFEAAGRAIRLHYSSLLPESGEVHIWGQSEHLNSQEFTEYRSRLIEAGWRIEPRPTYLNVPLLGMTVGEWGARADQIDSRIARWIRRGLSTWRRHFPNGGDTTMMDIARAYLENPDISLRGPDLGVKSVARFRETLRDEGLL